jgi:hypothetical protein
MAEAADVIPQIDIDRALLIDVLDDVCRLTETQRDVLVNDGYDTARSLVHWNYKSIRNWCESKCKLALNRGGCTYGDRKIKCIQALAYWCTNAYLQGKPLDIEGEYDDDAQDEAIIESELDYNDSKKDAVLDKPSKFSHEKWQEWEESIYNYFSSSRNVRGIPYSYVIRKEPNPMTPTNMERDDFIIYNAQLTGTMFKRDSKHVFQILKELTNGTQAEDWMKGKSCGRTAMIALQEHYDGTAEGERRMAVAKSDLSKLFYRNETTFSFEKYVTKLLTIFNILEKYKFPVYEKDKVEYLLNKVQCPDKDFQMTVNICRSSHSDNFVQASTYLQTEVARIFPSAQPSSGRYGKNRYIKAFGRGGGRGGRGRFGGRGGRGRFGGRGGRGHGRGDDRPNRENGVDISDPTRWYDDEELSALSSATRNYVLQHPDRQKAIEERKRKRDDRRNNSSAKSTKRSEEEQGKLVTAMVNAQRNAAAVNGTIYPQNGSSRNRNTASANRNAPPPQVSTNNSSEASVLTFDHLGNIIE